MSSRTRAHEEVAQGLVAEALASGSGVRLRVRGSCMDPLLYDGDWVWVVPLRKVQLGAVVLAKSKNGSLVCHRLLKRGNSGLLLSGDRSFALEEHPPEHVWGEVKYADQGKLRLLLDGGLRRRFGHFLAKWHLFSYGLKGRRSGRWVEALRQRFVDCIHRLSWRLGGRSATKEEPLQLLNKKKSS